VEWIEVTEVAEAFHEVEWIEVDMDAVVLCVEGELLSMYPT
jgi:hypothetical protein